MTKNQKENMETKEIKKDEDGNIIVAENVKIIFNAEINPLNSIESE